MWKDCGYLSLTKDGKKLSVVVKHARYVANLEEVKAVLDGKLNFKDILEPPNKGNTNDARALISSQSTGLMA